MGQTYLKEIEINASRDKVWKVFKDFESYPQWAKFISIIERKSDTTLNVTLTLEDGKPMVMSPVVLKEDEYEFVWRGKVGISGIFDGEHQFKVETVDENTSRFIQKEEFGGILVAPILWYIGDQTRDGFEAFNKALKERVESL
jgi:hypothetical protein